ncbi:acetyltransferase (GNAT) family [Clostridium pasteurianum DSM 525 = ATCC 6013]|uniref:Acetyltransferase (GNAT) family n=1 Tax=Clostridium pasteurianum DSM 525 = ATCC 6013 TaxID=1262449 RepID=A0A0H3J888_CLOPA|nr:GNAT family N-acetyltransferase [Clostridium pasteurianum]AJA47250.1 acetyltransferase (GNAT) family [Clostridium pasteurianum DSM 525 = ATCC 6013]AJA51238.1 acetyltransferase (GNAT) family [Clostridium pasteurianum DSM 525 = ATCC 6013]AOZ74600.1 hypothetical protein AQ983_05560 [Clostridium pasteurianum DSM 525 = ATCC 6013]AOZ78397.1 hypothetical protein AQ984_05550 [Clostridium pasteurianum]ELP59366.1 acetyltransferase [Clostridium pasteurianum DSM 525 = ATCC 6013]
MIIRKATEADTESLVKLRIRQLIDEGYSLKNENKEMIFNEIKSYFQQNIKTDRYISWIAIAEEKIVATSGLCFFRLPPSFGNPSGKIAYLTSIYTVPAYRKRGLATNLIQRMIVISKEQGYTVIRLHASEAGKSLYVKLGFRDIENDMILKI